MAFGPVLEANGVLLSRQVRNLRSMLTAEIDNLPEDVADQLFSERRRPRRSDKPLRPLLA